jgi:hypothetical protein
MRKILVVATVVALVGGTAWVALAAGNTQRGRTPLSCLDTVWRTTKVSTSSTHFSTVPGFRDAPFSIYPITVNVSAVVSGAPVKFRILSTPFATTTSHASQPGPARFVPSRGHPDSFGFQWVERNGSAAEHQNRLRLQWRSPSGRAVHLLRGDMSVAYTTDQCTGSS